MDRSDLETEIGRLLADTSHRRWSTTKLRDRIEHAQQQVQALTNAVKTKSTYTVTADTKEVTIGTSVIDVIRVTLTESDGDVNILAGRSRNDWDFYVPNWENEDAGKPKEYAFDASNSQLILRPKPSSDYVVTDGLTVREIVIPTALSGDSSEPFEANAAMQAYSMSIVHWVVAQCFMDDGSPESLAKARFHRTNNMDNPGEFEKWIKLINAKFDSPTSIPARLMWYPQGARRGGKRAPSKSYPLD